MCDENTDISKLEELFNQYNQKLSAIQTQLDNTRAEFWQVLVDMGYAEPEVESGCGGNCSGCKCS
jgi:hypothetical protein